jgi:hypothetical protein
MITMSTEAEQVYLYVFWKSAIKFDGSTPDSELISKKNNILYKIIKAKFGTFPKNLSDFEKIEKDFKGLTDNTKDLIIAFVYSGGKKKIMISHDSEYTAKYTESVMNYLSGSPGYKVIYDKVAMRHN